MLQQMKADVGRVDPPPHKALFQSTHCLVRKSAAVGKAEPTQQHCTLKKSVNLGCIHTCTQKGCNPDQPCEIYEAPAFQVSRWSYCTCVQECPTANSREGLLACVCFFWIVAHIKGFCKETHTDTRYEA